MLERFDKIVVLDLGDCQFCEPTPEICDDFDNDGDGITDEGCDIDEDGYCDIDADVVGTPAECTLGIRDCCDQDPDTFTGQIETFEDANACSSFDSNCHGEERALYRNRNIDQCKLPQCSSGDSWTSHVPECGKSVEFLLCSKSENLDNCTTSRSNKVQPCN